MWGRFRAWVMLAVAWLLMTSSRLLRIGTRYGLGAFERNYAADGILPTTREDRALLLQAGRCIACGRCERGDAALRVQGNPDYPGLMTLVLATTRNQPDFAEAAPSWSLLSEETLSQRQRRCPTAVPIARLGPLVQRLGAQQARAQAQVP
jgi:hypothetical protein